MNNRELADTFTLIANLLEIKGETVYKTLAYRRAAESLLALAGDVNQYWKEDRLLEIPGVGKSIAEKIEELMETGGLVFLQKLEREVPAGLAEWLRVPGLGPKKVALIWKELGITSLDALTSAARDGKLRKLPGLGEKSEAQILAGIESLARRSGGRVPLGRAWSLAQQIIPQLMKVKGVSAAEPAGSLRRMRPTVGDLDILVAARDSAPVMEVFTTLPGIMRVLGKGDTKASIEFADGVRAQVWVHPPERFGTALQYATGSKDHNVQLRQLALEKGLSLSEHALTEDRRVRRDNLRHGIGSLRSAWASLDPARAAGGPGRSAGRQGREASKTDRGPRHQGRLQTHSTWSDGALSMLELSRAAARRGIRVIAFTDHSVGLGMTNGLSMERHAGQQAEIQAIQRELGDSILVLHATEVEIKADGTLDYPDEFLATLDLVVVASMHSTLRQERDKVTERVIKAIRNPHVDIIGHPTGRLIPDRPGADLDMDAVLAAAAESGVALEINASPYRLDLEDIYARRARDMGIPLSINTDAHSEADLDMMPFGVATGSPRVADGGRRHQHVAH